MPKIRKWTRIVPVAGTLALVAAAVATPAAAAVNLIPNESAGALAIIVPVAILLTALIVEVWRLTTHKNVPVLERQIADERARKRRTGTHA